MGIRVAFSKKEKEREMTRLGLVGVDPPPIFSVSVPPKRERLFFHRLRNNESETGQRDVSLSSLFERSRSFSNLRRARERRVENQREREPIKSSWLSTRVKSGKNSAHPSSENVVGIARLVYSHRFVSYPRQKTRGICQRIAAVRTPRHAPRI